MRSILAIDTSGPVAGVAILQNSQIIYEACAITKYTHSVNEMPMIEEAFLRTGLSMSDISLLAVVTGPGSFTGVRIGVSMVKGMAHGANLPCVAIDGLEALAAGANNINNKIICPLMDARAGQVYAAAFALCSGQDFMPPKRLLEDRAIALSDFIKEVNDLGESFVFVGDGAVAYRDMLIEMLGERAVFLSPQNIYLRPSSVGLLAGCYEDKAVNYLDLMPMYLRAPQAERQRLAKENKEKNK